MTPQIVNLDPTTVVMDPRFQPRTGDGLVKATEVDRMRADGVSRGHASGWAPEIYDPIHVWEGSDDRVYVLEGFHRLALAVACEVPEVSVVYHVGIDEAEAIALADRSNMKTRPMDPVEEASVYRRAAEAGATWEEISGRYDRRTPSYYERRSAIAYLSPGILDAVRRKIFPVDYAEAIGEVARVGASPTLQEVLAKVAVTTKTRVDLFRRFARKAFAIQSGQVPTKDDGLGLFASLGISVDAGAGVAERILSDAAKEAQIGEGWAILHRSGLAQVRRLEKAGKAVPEGLAKLVAGIEAFRAESDRTIGSILGDTVETGDVTPGTESTIEAKPILKWVGSKRREASRILPLIRDRISPEGTYFEPFAGSLAVFFALAPSRAVIGDALPELVGMYRAIQRSPSGVADELKRLINKGLTAEAFAEVRAWVTSDDFQAAARTIYLNKTAFNGLYRTNSKGKFNAPHGRYPNPKFPSVADLHRAGDLLRGATIFNGDWKKTIETAGHGDAIFVDPPYPGTFTGYAGEADPVDMKTLGFDLWRKWRKGAGVIVTLPGMDEIGQFFDSWCDRVLIPRTSTVSCTVGGRTAVDQVAWASKKERS